MVVGWSLFRCMAPTAWFRLLQLLWLLQQGLWTCRATKQSKALPAQRGWVWTCVQWDVRYSSRIVCGKRYVLSDVALSLLTQF